MKRTTLTKDYICVSYKDKYHTSKNVLQTHEAIYKDLIGQRKFTS